MEQTFPHESIQSLAHTGTVPGRKDPVRITCAGASTTEGVGSSDSSRYSWPAWMGRLLGPDYSVYNAGSNGATAAKACHGSAWSYWDTDQFQAGKRFAPDFVTLMLGGNDASQWDHIGAEHFEADYRALIAEYRRLRSSPRIFLIEQTPCLNGDGRQEKIHAFVNPIVRSIGQELGLTVISLEERVGRHPEWFSEDLLHFNDEGYRQIAGILSRELLSCISKSSIK